MIRATRLTITGHLARDPEVKALDDGTLITHLIVGTTDRKRTDSGDWEDAGPTIWWDVSAWGNLGERAADTLTKGSGVTITGYLKTIRPWIGSQDGEPRATPQLTAYDITTALPRPATRPAPSNNPPTDPWGNEAPF